jgi:hypothetical protein
MNFNEIDPKVLEKTLKLMKKYNVQTLTCDGVTISIGAAKVKPPKLSPAMQAVNNKTKIAIPDAILYGASNAPKIDDFNRYSISKVLPGLDS